MGNTTFCPKCNYYSADEDFNICPECGVIIEKHFAKLEERQKIGAEELKNEKPEDIAGLNIQQKEPIRTQRTKDKVRPSEHHQQETTRRIKASTVLLLIITGLLTVDLYFSIDERMQRQEASAEALKVVMEIETKRAETFTDYVKAVNSDKAQSVYYQIYQANNAQLKMMNLMMQENKLLVALLAGKK